MSQLDLLTLPIEIRLKLYDVLFVKDQPIKILATIPAQPGGEDCWDIESCPLSSQFLRVCRQVHSEGLSYLYAHNVFDCSTREGLKLLLHHVGVQNCSRIKHLILDWEQLQDFAWSLAKEEYVVATSGLRSLQSAHWRNRAIGGASMQWRSVKSYERQLCQAAMDIVQKHANLKILVQQPCHRSGLLAATSANRVKWKFVGSIIDVQKDETVVNVQKELDALQPTKDEDIGSGGSLVIDPF